MAKACEDFEAGQVVILFRVTSFRFSCQKVSWPTKKTKKCCTAMCHLPVGPEIVEKGVVEVKDRIVAGCLETAHVTPYFIVDKTVHLFYLFRKFHIIFSAFRRHLSHFLSVCPIFIHLMILISCYVGLAPV